MTSGERPDLTGWTVLIVEDEPDNIRIPEMTLKHYGTEVYIAENGKQGLELLEKITPNFILLDLSMPVMDGWEMYKQVRANPETKDLIVIAMTAHAMEHDKQRALDEGFNGYIAKPFLFDTFFEEIMRATKDVAAPDPAPIESVTTSTNGTGAQ